MLMKVHAKGQVVIPAEIREELGISIGDQLAVHVDEERKCLQLSRQSENSSGGLAGSLRGYAKDKPFPSKEVMGDSLRRGLSGDA